MTSRRARIARLRQVALAGLGPYALPEGRLTFVSHGENTTFRHDSAAGRHHSVAPVQNQQGWGNAKVSNTAIGPRRCNDARQQGGHPDPATAS